MGKRQAILDNKDRNLKRIMEVLEDGPKTSSALLQKMPEIHTLMSLNRYLRTLEALGNVVHEGELYHLAKKLQQIEYTRENYKLAMNHTRLLLFSNDISQLFDVMGPTLILTELTLNQKEYPELMSHLKTGYFKELWLPLERYRELAKKYKVGGSTSISELLKPVMKTLYPEQLPEGFGPSIEKPVIPEKDKNELTQLGEKILSNFGLIMFRAEHGAPLKGTCQVCPSKSVIIE